MPNSDPNHDAKKFNSVELAKDSMTPMTGLEKFKKIIEDKYKLKFNNYLDLHKWTVDNFPSFWEEVWIHFGIVFSKTYDEVFVKTGPNFLDVKWFVGAKLNYAENLLRIRDDREALICLDKEGNVERVTFAELYNEVKIYAAAFRKQGLHIGDTVACYMSNRKEAVIAMLAVTSVGAIWGGPHAFAGAKVASNIIHKLDAKFLISGDRYTALNKEFDLLSNLPIIAENVPTLERIIIVPTTNETLLKDISNIPNSCFLDDFLSTGRNPDGEVPDLVFEQLPFDHPVFVNFSSGTTGLPKGPVHSVGCLFGPTVDFALHYNMKSGDTIYSLYAMGWIIWHYQVSALSMGIKLFLHDGIYNSRSGNNMWDVLAEHKVNFIFLVTGLLDKMEKDKMYPKPNASFKNLHFIAVGASPVKLQNFEYMRSIVKSDSFIVNMYGATENFGAVSGCDTNSPSYSNEVQVPAFGRDIHIFDKDGRSVVGDVGELVITKPFPNFVIRLWKDKDNELLNQTYQSKFPGSWQQHDEAYINPKTKGIVVIGRSDDTLTQGGGRFGSNDIYFAIHSIEEIEDYICVSQKKSDVDTRLVLFIKMKEGHALTPEFKEKVEKRIETELFINYVPEVILPVNGIPYNSNNKRVESLVRKIIATNQVPHEVNNVTNPECLVEYCNRPEIVNYKE